MSKINPLKSKPLRYAGQSCDEHIEKIRDNVIPMAIIPLIFVLLSFYLWGIYFLNLSILNIAILSTVVSIVSGAYAYFKVVKVKKEIENYKLGRDGEKIVAQTLEEARSEKTRLFHDVIKDELNNTSNIDHIIVSEKGVFVIETKTLSKSSNVKINTIVFDGENLFKNNAKISNNYVGQISASVDWLEKTLKERTTRTLPLIKGVLVFPEWWVERRISDGKKSQIWAFNEKRFKSYLGKLPNKLSHEDIKVVSTVIKEYMSNHRDG